MKIEISILMIKFTYLSTIRLKSIILKLLSAYLQSLIINANLMQIVLL
jgi:hypothetical protein